jgi:RNA polymerase sigma-70 factor (ECF subfamily)
MGDELEEILIKKAKQGNIAAFEKLIISHERRIYNIAYRMFNNEEDAKDITQEVFLKVYKNIDKFDENSKISTWIHRICVNTCIDEIRKRKGKETFSMDESIISDETSTQKQYINDALTPEEVLITKEEIKDIKKAIASLPEKHKTIIILRDIQNLSYSEIADITESSLGTVKSRLARARLQLKNIIMSDKELSKPESRLKI